FALMGCATSKIKFDNMAEENAISILQVDVSINGKDLKEGGLSHCFVHFKQGEAKKYIRAQYLHAHSFIVMKSKPGPVYIDYMNCMEFKVFYNRERAHVFEKKPAFEAKANFINYAGRLSINYTPHAFSLADLIHGFRGITKEDFRVTMKLRDDFESAKELFLEEYKEVPEGFTFRRSLFKDHGQIVR
ncbi:MAG: hypothetical protein OXT65_01860, partial [Alphaproteobacteria bacterium]|nr:hypothetical protein [Alphaproteobacteria bacterium]